MRSSTAGWLTPAATIYKHTPGPAWDEAGEIGCAEAKDFFGSHATERERIFKEANTPRTQSCPALSDGARPRGTASSQPPPTRTAWRKPGEAPVRMWIQEEDFAARWRIMEHDKGAANLPRRTR